MVNVRAISETALYFNLCRAMQVKLTSILVCLANDCAVDTLTIGYLVRRLQSEGIGFLTVTLPKLAKAVLRSIEIGYFDYKEHPDLCSFARKGRSLRYFRSFLDRIFAKNGTLLPEPCVVTLQRLRQLCEYAYKLAMEFKDGQIEDAQKAFLQTEKEVGSYAYDWAFIEKLRKDFETHYPEISRATVSEILRYARPRPGSGTFAGEHDSPWYVVKTTDYNYRPEFAAYSGYFKPYPSAPVTPRGVKDTSEWSEVLFVPKDSRGPRTIVREPYRRLYLQMAFHDWITDALEKATHNRVNFRDQTINQRLAEEASYDRKNATLDLKEASDRVSYRVMARIFQNSPGCRYMLSNRSSKAKLGERLITLHKVAGMGSGLTFPTMSLLITLSITREVLTRLPFLHYNDVRSRIYVYGDDIVLPTAWVDLAYSALSRVGLKVNVQKSYVRSHFRESCGGDYYFGFDVGPVRLRLMGAEIKATGNTLTVGKKGNLLLGPFLFERHCRELVNKGLKRLSEYYYKCIERYTGMLPYVSGESPVMGRYEKSNDLPYLCDRTGLYETIRALVPVPRFTEEHSCPYVIMGRKLRERRFGLEFLQGGNDPSAIAKPRDIRVVRRAVSAYRLMG